jgi:hypothetical protein
MLDDREDTMKCINALAGDSLEIYAAAVGAAFSVMRMTIDEMPVLRTAMDYMER